MSSLAMELSLSTAKLACLLLVGFILVPRRSLARNCRTSCGNVPNISYPFRLQNDPDYCGDSRFQLSCEKNQTTLELSSKKYIVESIVYDDYSIRIVDPGVFGNNCSYVPQYRVDQSNYDLYLPSYGISYSYLSVVFLNCPVPVNDSLYIAATSCGNASNKDASYSYVLVDYADSQSVGELHTDCSVTESAHVDFTGDYELQNLNYSTIRGLFQDGIILTWSIEDFTSSGSSCSLPFHSSRCFLKFLSAIGEELLTLFRASVGTVGHILLVRTVIGILCFSAFLIYKLRRRHLAMDHKTEEFLSEYKNQMPARYSYWELFRMTNRFTEKLGQGGFGSVYKGKLPNGTAVAVKMLGQCKGNGQDFINEVATIGRIHHMHVVQLVGFCAERSKRALVYEFMPNGSLDKYLSSRIGADDAKLSWNKLQEIALGVARGIEYLHRGCSMKILHFDIKPHNILLDENFTPKVSDFGLAKFYPIEDSIVSLTAVRGTIGYIAPELFYRRVGNVSYKSDVYSYGMLLMEMAGRRKNFLANQHANSSSHIYFPSWIYDQLILGDLGLEEDVADDEKDTAKKLVMVALWCIQMKPIDRPSMSGVVEMLEGSVEHLEMPRKPFMASSDHWARSDDQAIEIGAADSFKQPSSSESILSPR